MDTVTIPSKYQIVIPQKILVKLKLNPGDKLRVLRKAHQIILIPVRYNVPQRGLLKGIDTNIDREEDRL